MQPSKACTDLICKMYLGRSYLTTITAYVQNTTGLEGEGGDNRWWKFHSTFTVSRVTCQLSNTAQKASQKRLPCLQGMRNLSCGQMSINHDQHKNDIQFSTMHFSCLGVFTSSVESRFSSHLSNCHSCRIPKDFKDKNLTRSCERENRPVIYCLSPA